MNNTTFKSTLFIILFTMNPAAFAAGKDYSDQDLPRRDFSSKDIEGSNFESSGLKEANFTSAQAAHCNFKGADFDQTVLNKADMSFCDFRKCKFEYPRVSETDFSSANFEGADLSHATFIHVKFRNANLKNLKGITNSQRSDFRGADVRGANLTLFKEGVGELSKFRGAFYDRATKWPKGFDPEDEECILLKDPKAEPDRTPKPPRQGTAAKKDFRDKDYTRSTLLKKDFETADCEGVDFNEANITDMQAAGANFYAADFTWGHATKSDFSKADFRNIRLNSWVVRDCNFTSANFEGLKFDGGQISTSNFKGANLSKTRGYRFFDKVTFQDADLRGADLSDLRLPADLAAAFKGAKYNKKTQWPAKFDPEAAGAVKVD